MKKTLHVTGMHCTSCEILLEQELTKDENIKEVTASLKNQTIRIASNFKSQYELLEQVNKLIKPFGYSVNLVKQGESKNYKETITAVIIAITLITIFMILQKNRFLDLISINTTNYTAIFIIGIAASLSSCAAVVGGLLLSLSSSLAKHNLFSNKTLIAFHISRLISFFILGGSIGFLGSAININIITTIILNSLLALVMLILGFNLLEIFDFTKKLQLTLPSSIFKKIKINSQNSFISSIILGASTFFLPCGFTQSMQLYALSTQNFSKAALIMLIFALGTLPMLFLITISSASFSKSKYSKIFFKTAGIIVIAFGFFNLYNALVVAQIIR